MMPVHTNYLAPIWICRYMGCIPPEFVCRYYHIQIDSNPSFRGTVLNLLYVASEAGYLITANPGNDSATLISQIYLSTNIGQLLHIFEEI